MAKKTKKNPKKTNQTEDSINLQKVGVVITRPKALSEFLINAIQSNNGTAFNIQCLEISDPTDVEHAQQECRNNATEVNYWAFTSPNAVDYALKFGLDFSLNKPCISIGAGTTQKLKELTSAEIIQGDAPYTTEKLLEKLSTLSLVDQSISIFSGEGGRRLLENALNEQGAHARYIDVYRRTPIENIDLSEVIDYNNNNHPLVILVSSQEAFAAYHQAALANDPNLFEHTLIVASERLADYVTTLGYTNIHIANSAVSADLWQKLTEVLPELFLPTINDSHKDSFMTQKNDNENPTITEEPTATESQPAIQKEPQAQNAQPTIQAAVQKPNHSLSYIAIALGVIGIGIGAFAFLQTAQNSTHAQDIKRALETQVEQQKTQITNLSQTLTTLQKTVDTERGQSTDFTDLSDTQKQHQQTLQALQQRLTSLDSAISNLQADNGTSVTRYNQLNDHLNQFEKVVTNLDQSINQIGKSANDVQNDAVKTQNRLTSQLVEINSKIASLKALEDHLSATTDIDLLNLSQAQYLLRLANFKLMFENDTTEAAEILKEASQRLMATANAKFSETNNLIQSEIVKLNNIPTVNREADAERIQNITNIIPSISTKSDDILGELKNTFHSEVNKKEAEDSDSHPWYKKAMDKVKPAFIINQERTAAPDLMSITDDALLKQNIQLQLTTARLALLQNQVQTYQASLKTARTLLTNYFSANDDQYHQALAAINDLLSVNVSSETLNIDPILKSFDASMLNYRGEGL